MSDQDLEKALFDSIYRFKNDPLGFVNYVFPWKEPGTALQDEDGLDTWQAELLQLIGEKCRENDGNPAADAIRVAVASGHGVGKTKITSDIILWFMSTRPNPQVVVTANTKTQLLTKTWRELSKWHKLSIHKHWFKWTATKFYHISSPETWAANAIPFSEQKSEAFAGTHEENVLVVFDEASAIPDVIWEVSEGALTTPGAIFLAFGNPTLNTGRFKDAFGKYRHRFHNYRVDSRTAKKADQKIIKQWIEDYGEDSDFVRVRVKGQFPRAGSQQLIPVDLCEAAMNRHLEFDVYRHAAKILAVDCARFGDDQSVILKRQGLKVLDIKRFREIDLMTLSSHLMYEADQWKPDAIFIDQGGLGAGVVDRCRQLGYRVVGVDFGGKAGNDNKYFNKRAEMWGSILEWLKSGGSLPNDNELRDDLIGPEYSFSAKEQIQLERKADMKKRGLASPDSGDALAISFFQKVMTSEDKTFLRKRKAMLAERREYDPHRRFRNDIKERKDKDDYPHRRFRSR